MLDSTYGELRLRYQRHLARRRANNRIFWLTVILFSVACLLLGLATAPRAAAAAEDETQPAEQLTGETQELHVESNILDVGPDGVILTDEEGVAKVRYDFTDSPYPIIEDENCTAECRDAAIVSGIGAYIKQRNRNVDSIQIATWLTEAKAKYGPDVPLEAAVPTMWKESTFKCGAHNYLNCIGFFQWMYKYHAADMRKLGLDIYNPQDNIDYFFIHVQADLDRGYSLDRAMGPWEVWWKYGARTEYKRLLEQGWPQ